MEKCAEEEEMRRGRAIIGTIGEGGGEEEQVKWESLKTIKWDEVSISDIIQEIEDLGRE